jgi:hypothetical protein
MSQRHPVTIGRRADCEVKEKRTGGREISYAAPIAPRSSWRAGQGLCVGSLQLLDQRPLLEDRISSHGPPFSQRLFGSRSRRDERSSTSACSQYSKSRPAGRPLTSQSCRALCATSSRPSSIYAWLRAPIFIRSGSLAFNDIRYVLLILGAHPLSFVYAPLPVRMRRELATNALRHHRHGFATALDIVQRVLPPGLGHLDSV